MERKTNDNDYVLGASIEYFLEFIHGQLLHFLHFELFISLRGQAIVLVRVLFLLFFIIFHVSLGLQALLICKVNYSFQIM
jgi:hypothetical protein